MYGIRKIYRLECMPFNINLSQLKSFVLIVEVGTFSKAAEIVGRTQSALSLQIKNLEEELGCRLVDRVGRSVSLTKDGEVLLSYAKRMIKLESELFLHLKDSDLKGEIRIGTPEDFATHYLPDVLATFRNNYQNVQLSVYCDLTLNLLEGFRKGFYDLILVKRDPELVKEGTKVWRESLLWVSSKNYEPEPTLSLVLSPEPCIYRSRALAALDKIKRSWRIIYTSPSLAGTLAAVRAGLGVAVLPEKMLPSGICPISKNMQMPKLAEAEIAMIKKPHLSKAAQTLADYIIESMERKK